MCVYSSSEYAFLIIYCMQASLFLLLSISSFRWEKVSGSEMRLETRGISQLH